jgi:hypothetical protein
MSFPESDGKGTYIHSRLSVPWIPPSAMMASAFMVYGMGRLWPFHFQNGLFPKECGQISIVMNVF